MYSALLIVCAFCLLCVVHFSFLVGLWWSNLSLGNFGEQIIQVQARWCRWYAASFGLGVIECLEWTHLWLIYLSEFWTKVLTMHSFTLFWIRAFMVPKCKVLNLIMISNRIWFGLVISAATFWISRNVITRGGNTSIILLYLLENGF